MAFFNILICSIINFSSLTDAAAVAIPPLPRLINSEFPTAFLPRNRAYPHASNIPTTSKILTKIPPPPHTHRAPALLRSQTTIPMTSRSMSLPPPPAASSTSSFEGIVGCQLIKRIGKGTYGEVYHVRMQNQNEDGALKVFRAAPTLQINKLECETERAVLREIILFEKESKRKLQTSHLMQGIQGASCPNLMMEYIKGSDLSKINPISFTYASLIDFVLSLMTQMESVLNDLHSINIYHNDIKPENILYDPNERLFHLIDFGLAVPLSLLDQPYFRKMNFWTTLPFMSPFHLEIIEKIKLNGKMQNDENTRMKARFSDFYSLGVTAITVLANNCFGNEAICLMAKRIERRQRLFASQDNAGFVRWSVAETKAKMMPYWRIIQETVLEEYKKRMKDNSSGDEVEMIGLLAKWFLVKPSYFENII